MTLLNIPYISWLLRCLTKKVGLWGLLGIGIACISTLIYSANIAEIRQEIDMLETRIMQKQMSNADSAIANTPVAQTESLQTLSEFYQTFPSTRAIPDTLAQLNSLAAKQQLLLNSGDYKLNKIAVKNSVGATALTQYEMVLPVEGSYSRIRAFISSILNNLPSVAITDIQIKRDSTLSPTVDARLVLIFYVRGDQA
jgi:hypothetical protein